MRRITFIIHHTDDYVYTLDAKTVIGSRCQDRLVTCKDSKELAERVAANIDLWEESIARKEESGRLERPDQSHRSHKE